MNPGGVRSDLTYLQSSSAEGDGVVTYGEAFTFPPFGNDAAMVGLEFDSDLEGTLRVGIDALQTSFGCSVVVMQSWIRRVEY